MKCILPLALFLVAGCVSYPVYDRQLTRQEKRNDRSQVWPLVVAVKAAPEQEFRKDCCIPPEADSVRRDMQEAVSNLTADLRETRLFRDVKVWQPAVHADLTIDVHRASGVTFCGTPFLTYAITLGLVSAESRCRHMYDFRFVSPRTGRWFEFKRNYAGSMYAPSILLLPVVILWPRTTEVDLLRHDLIEAKPAFDELMEPAK